MTSIRAPQDRIAPPTSPEEWLASLSLEADDEATEASRDLGQLSRELRSEAQRSQLAQERRAAEETMIAGIVQGVGQMVAGACTIASGAFGVDGANDLPANASEATRQAHGQLVSDYQGIITGAGDLGNAGAGIGAALLKADASESQARATEAEHAAQAATESIQGATEDLRAIRESSERATEALKTVLNEKRRAEDAAMRA